MPNLSGISGGVSILPCKASLGTRSACARLPSSNGVSISLRGFLSGAAKRAINSTSSARPQLRSETTASTLVSFLPPALFIFSLVGLAPPALGQTDAGSIFDADTLFGAAAQSSAVSQFGAAAQTQILVATQSNTNFQSGAAAQAGSQAVATETQASCPALAPFYPGAYFRSEGDSSPGNNAAVAAPPESQQQWQGLVSELVPLQSRCLRSSEYYALLGAAQLNAGALDLAAEALERALLLDADNGAAQIDYAEVLLRQGQLFPALQLNAVLEAREDLPEELRQSVVQRGTQWRGLTKQNSVQLDASGGYDSNLNGAPDSGQLTLTLSGEPVVLNLTEDFQPVEGAFSNLRVSTRAVTLTEAGRRSWDHEVRARVSEDRQSDLLQFSSQFSQATATRRRSVLFEAGASSIFFGGSSLYTATQARLRVQSNTSKRCAPVYDLASQYQRFHAQPALDAWESKATVGLNCLKGRSTAADVVQRYGIDASYIVSKALSANRPGDDRDGFQLSARYQRPLLRGELLAQATVTHLRDENTYSALLAGGDERWQRRNQILIQHRTPFALGSKPALFTVGLFYQDQASNIALFDMDDASVELGISIPL